MLDQALDGGTQPAGGAIPRHPGTGGCSRLVKAARVVVLAFSAWHKTLKGVESWEEMTGDGWQEAATPDSTSSAVRVQGKLHSSMLDLSGIARKKDQGYFLLDKKFNLMIQFFKTGYL